MVELAGSEVLTLELAEALGQRGCQVTVYAHVTGDPIAGIAHQRGVRLTEDADGLPDLEGGLLWLHHQVVPAAAAGAVGTPGTTVVCAHMSPFEPLEAPFLGLEDRLAAAVAVNSDETAAAVREAGVTEAPIVVLGNPAPETFWQAAAPRRHVLQRLLFVTNHMPDELRLAMERLRGSGLEIEAIGASGRVALVTPEDIVAADAVVTIGKTVQYALAVGRPVFCYDVHGGPGWLTAAQFDTARAHNFSGRHFPRMTADELVAAVTTGFAAADAEVDGLREAIASVRWPRGLDRVLAAAGEARRPAPLTEPEKRRLDAYFRLAHRTAREHYALARSERRLRGLQEALRAARVEQANGEVCARLYEQQLASVAGSWSWRLTSPLRRGADIARQRRAAASTRSEYRRPSGVVAPTVRRLESLPALAWLCRLTDDAHELVVGPEVEVGPDGISEGVWAGDLQHETLRTSPAVFGSGVVFTGEGPLFVPPSQPLEALFVLDDLRSGSRVVSNSMCFTLAQLPDAVFEDFCRLLGRSLRETVDRAGEAGIEPPHTDLLTSGGYRLTRHVYFRFLASPGKPISRQDAAPMRPFADFHTYREHLSRSLAEVLANAGDPRRTRVFDPVVSLSRGYDSPAVGVLAAENGCRRALTLRARVYGREDDGEILGRKLGLDVDVRRHILGSDIDDLSVELDPVLMRRAFEFLATEGVGDDIAYLPFESALSGSLLLSGSFGDTLWSRDARADGNLSWRAKFCKSLTEYRLRVGFVHVPVPSIGGRAGTSITAISRSAEMAPYSVGGDYDRPIPRRIGEEAGLARSDFGCVKTATAPLITNGPDRFVDAVTETCRRYARLEAT